MQTDNIQPIPRRLDRGTPVAALLIFLSVGFSTTPCEAARFHCASGDVACLIAAIHEANANGHENTIKLAAGTYTLSIVDNSTDGPTGLPVVTSTLSITGAGADLTSIERAATAPSFRIFDVASTGVLMLDQVTVQRGGGRPFPATGPRFFPGAGILAFGTVKITDSVVTGNLAPQVGDPGIGYGGGIAGGNVIVTRSTVSGNRALAGGGIYIAADGNLTVNSSTITQNGTSGAGGGIWFQSQGMLKVADSVISGNSSDVLGLVSFGGGIAVGDPSSVTGAVVTITDTSISNNSRVGGIAIYPGNTAHIRRSSIVGNFSFIFGSAIQVGPNSTVTIDDSTIANNLAFDAPSDLELLGTTIVRNSTIVGSPTGSTPGNIFNYGSTSLENTILSLATTGPNVCPTKITSLGHNLIKGDTFSCVDRVSSDLDGDPGLGGFVDPGRPGTGHFPLLASSRAIDAGDNTACHNKDQLRLARPIDGNGDGVGTCDIGSVEFYPIVNDLVRLDALSSTFVQPSSTQTNPLTAGGEFRISAVFTNIGGREICHVAFAVTTLQGETGSAPVLVTKAGQLIGSEGIVMPARLAGAESDLDANKHERYTFWIGVSQTQPITFLVNVLGEATAGACEK